MRDTRAVLRRSPGNLNEKAHVEFSIFDGDLKAGGDGACTDQLYTQSLASFNTFKRPVVVVPGDNDWTDCWGRYGPGTGGFDALERLDHERQVFYPTDQSLGRHTLTVQRESSEPGYEKYRENVRWMSGPVMYIGLNVQGSNDNLPHAGVDGENRPAGEIARMAAEHQQREKANIHWLAESYDQARRLGLKGVLVDWQADPNFNNEQKLQPAQYDGYAEILPELRKQVIAFPGQSALVHGDSHYFKLDKPLSYDNGQVVEKFTRLRRSEPPIPTGWPRPSTHATRTCSSSAPGSSPPTSTTGSPAERFWARVHATRAQFPQAKPGRPRSPAQGTTSRRRSAGIGGCRGR